MSGEAPLIAAIEAGGTKFNCALGRGPGEILELRAGEGVLVSGVVG
jgi:predicted NBD/HSP70 family sugar kinase